MRLVMKAPDGTFLVALVARTKRGLNKNQKKIRAGVRSMLLKSIDSYEIIQWIIANQKLPKKRVA